MRYMNYLLQEHSQIHPLKWQKKNLGDNYKYYERKFLLHLNPNENSYTVHQRRNERVIYGNVPIEKNNIEINGRIKTYKMKRPHAKHYKDRNQINTNNNNIYPNNDQDLGGQNYMIYNKYYENSYNYGGGNEIGGYQQFENNIQENKYNREKYYY